ncbi:hypothetical protein B0H14DRAFT_3490226 [Mycena olivaceomarginata]|nr:hypothetical protein B0H14DRAFT_3490226 [Mycena olivaceomarginata]
MTTDPNRHHTRAATREGIFPAPKLPRDTPVKANNRWRSSSMHPHISDLVLKTANLYRHVFEDLLAVPVIPCVKSGKEKFAGSLYTTTVEGFIPTSGRGIQGTTSPRAELFVEDPNDPSGGKTFVWENSWGLATRTTGVKVMVHGDNKGLVLLPPMTDEGRAVINNACEEPAKTLKKGYTPGYKFNDWERKQQTLTVPRDTGVKHPIALGPTIVALHNDPERDNGTTSSPRSTPRMWS